MSTNSLDLTTPLSLDLEIPPVSKKELLKEYDRVADDLLELKIICAQKRHYLALAKEIILKDVTSLKELHAAINSIISKETEQAYYEKFKKIMKRYPSQTIYWEMITTGLPHTMLTEYLEYLPTFGFQFYEILRLIADGRLKKDAFIELEEIYKNVILPHKLGSNEANKRFELAITTIRQGIPIELILKGIRLGFCSKLHVNEYDYSKPSYWYHVRDTFFTAIKLVYQHRVTFDDLKDLSEFDIKLMYLVTDATVVIVKTMKTKCEKYPLEEIDIDFIISRKNGDCIPVMNTLAELNPDQRVLWKKGFSLDKARQLPSHGVKYEHYERVSSLFTQEGFELFFSDPKMKDEILRILPTKFLPEPKTHLVSATIADLSSPSTSVPCSFLGFSVDRTAVDKNVANVTVTTSRVQESVSTVSGVTEPESTPKSKELSQSLSSS